MWQHNQGAQETTSASAKRPPAHCLSQAGSTAMPLVILRLMGGSEKTGCALGNGGTREQVIGGRAGGQGVCGHRAMRHPIPLPTSICFTGVFHAPAETGRINKSAASLTAQKYRLALRGARGDSDAHFALLQVLFLA
jgi:hypothetical protein